MLKGMRKNTKVIIWGVIISFVLWGGFSVSTQFQKKGRFAGEIFGKGITFQEFDSFYRAVQIFSFDGRQTEDPDQLRQQAWQSLILTREAQKQGLKVKDQEIRDEILRLLAAQKIDNPTPEEYHRWLQLTLRETPQQFEKQVRDLLLIQKLVEKVQADIQAKPDEETAFQRYLTEEKKITLEMIKFPTAEEAAAFRKDHADIKSWEKAKKGQPDRVTAMTQISAASLTQQWGMQAADMEKLFALPEKTLSEPMAIGGGFGVFQTFERSVPDRAGFDKVKETYLKKMAEEENSRRFVEWNIKLLADAGLKDYLNEAETE